MRFPDELWSMILKVNKRRAIRKRLASIFRATLLVRQTADWYNFVLVEPVHDPVYHSAATATMRWHFYPDIGREILFWKDKVVYRSEEHPFTGYGIYLGPALPCGRTT